MKLHVPRVKLLQEAENITRCFGVYAWSAGILEEDVKLTVSVFNVSEPIWNVQNLTSTSWN